MPVVHPCLGCGINVRLRQQYFVCISCKGWQHRTCTQFSQQDYRDMKQGTGILAWKCSRCPRMDLEDLLNSTSSTDIGSPEAESTEVDMDVDPEYSTTMPVVNMDLPNGDSFNVDRPFDVPDRFEEDTLQEMSLPTNISEPVTESVTYSIVEGATQRGNPLLVDSEGFIYTVKKTLPGRTTWRCKVRGKSGNCSAMVFQSEDIFSSSQHPHNHLAKPGETVLAKVSALLKSKAKVELFKPGSHLVEDVIIDEAPPSDPGNAELVVSHLIRKVNRVRQQLRPDEPTDLAFEIDDRYIPENFLQKDLILNGARHLVLATTEQLHLLKKAKTWYLDGTFKIVQLPFTQLFSIHGFMKGDDGDIKQVPLLFSLMSRRQRIDYEALFDCVKTLIPDLAVKKFVLDFELATWKAVPSVFPDVKLVGCVFHWTQAVWRKTQELGLSSAYNSDEAVHDYIRKLLALPFLPSEHISDAFQQLESRSTGAVQPLVSYMKQTWITSTTWNPEAWSVFNQPIRTNNDTEGWHRRMNGKAGRSNLPMYMMIPLLHRESKIISINRRLVKDGKLRRYQRKVYKASQGKIMKYWEQYEAENITTSKLLKKISKIVKV